MLLLLMSHVFIQKIMLFFLIFNRLIFCMVISLLHCYCQDSTNTINTIPFFFPILSAGSVLLDYVSSFCNALPTCQHSEMKMHKNYSEIQPWKSYMCACAGNLPVVLVIIIIIAAAMAKRFKPPQTRVVDICIDDETHEWSTLVLPLNCTPRARDVLNKLKERHISVKN